jgi:hypothetical protein
MRILTTIALLATLLMVGCTATTVTPEPTDISADAQAQAVIDNYFSDGIVATLQRDFDADMEVRQANWMVPIYQQREWLGWYFADNYSDMLGNSLFGKQFMMCYLYYYAIFRDTSTGQYWFGSQDYFNDPNALNDYQIFAFVMALEEDGVIPFWPITEPEC